MAIDPITAAYIVSSLGGGVLSGLSQGKATDKQIAAQRDLQKEEIAFRESALNPFRQQLQQAGALGRLDLMENAQFAPTTITPAARYASSVPQVRGGFSYAMDPAVRAAAGTLKGSVMSGHTAPTMTTRANYGKTAAMALRPDGRSIYDSTPLNVPGPSADDLDKGGQDDMRFGYQDMATSGVGPAAAFDGGASTSTIDPALIRALLRMRNLQ